MDDRKHLVGSTRHAKRDSKNKAIDVRQFSELKSMSSMPLNNSKRDVLKPVSSCPLVSSKGVSKNESKIKATQSINKSSGGLQDKIKKMKERIVEVEKVTLEYKTSITKIEKELESIREDISELDALKATEEAIEKALTDKADYLERKEILQELLVSKHDLEKEIIKDEEKLAKVMQSFNEAREIQLSLATCSIPKREAMPASETHKPEDLKYEDYPSKVDTELQDKIYMAEIELQALIEENETLHSLLKSKGLAV